VAEADATRDAERTGAETPTGAAPMPPQLRFIYVPLYRILKPLFRSTSAWSTRESSTCRAADGT
jgi:hypothetical protein